MRVLSVIPDPREGGPHRRSLAVARELREHDIETVFLLPEAGQEFAERAESEDCTVRQIAFPRIRSPRKVGANARFLLGFRGTVRRIQRVIAEERIDVVHANTPLNFQTALAAARSDAALVWHFNDTLTPWPLTRIAAAAALRWADVSVVAADAVHDHFFAPDVDTETVYAPVDTDEFDPDREVDEAAKRADLGIDPDVPVVGMVGNINPVKGVDTFIEAMGHLTDDYGEVEGVVVGSRLDSQADYYDEVVGLRDSLGLEDEVTFAGWRSDVPELLSLFDVFALPSNSEACPIVVLEAMAMGCPVVATSVGGVPELLRDGTDGWVVPPENPSALAGAIRAALENPQERERRAASALERVRERFSLDACVDRHVDVYRLALDRRADGG